VTRFRLASTAPAFSSNIRLEDLGVLICVPQVPAMTIHRLDLTFVKTFSISSRLLVCSVCDDPSPLYHQNRVIDAKKVRDLPVVGTVEQHYISLFAGLYGTHP